jgi:hypothetical protein
VKKKIDTIGITASQALLDPHLPYEIPILLNVSNILTDIMLITVIYDTTKIGAYHKYIYGLNGLDKSNSPKVGPSWYTYTLFHKPFNSTKRIQESLS